MDACQNNLLGIFKLASELAGHGNNDFSFGFTTSLEFYIAIVESVLHPPGKGFDFFALAFLSSGECGADARWLA